MRYKNYFAALRAISVASLVFSSVNSFAVERENQQLDFVVDSEFGYIDNFLFTDGQEQSTAFLALSPKFNYRYENRQNQVSLGIEAEHQRFAQFSGDKQTNYAVLPSYKYNFTNNKQIQLTGQYIDQTELRGRGISTGRAMQLTQPDEKHQYQLGVSYKVGQAESLARWSLGFFHSGQQYDTRRNITRLLDSTTNAIGSQFDYLLSGKTYLVAELLLQQIDFAHDEILNKSQQTALLGVAWSSTEISQFKLLLGYQKLDFDNAQLSDDDTFKWRLDYLWRPLEYSQFHFISERSFEAPNRLTSSYSVADRHQILTVFDINDYLQLSTSLAVVREQIHFSANVEKNDYLSAALKLNYALSNRSQLFTHYQFNNLSSDSAHEYQRTSLSVGITMQF